MIQLLPPTRDLPRGACCSPTTSLRRLQAGSGQVLAVVCSDHDRVCFDDLDPARLTWMQSAANLIEGEAALATVAYAVELEGALDIVVCSHLDCPSLEHILSLDGPELPDAWRQVGPALREPIVERYGPLMPHEERFVTAAEHTLSQTEALARHPSVAGAIQQRGLRLHTWLHCELTGALYVYEPFTGQFAAAATAGQP